MTKISKSEKVPKQMKAKFDAIVMFTDTFCNEYLNEEYAQLARQAVAALCRKRPSPLMQGRVKIWACGSIYALGYVNFLFDKSQEPHMSATDLSEGFGVSKSTGSAKSKAVRDALGMVQLDPNWYLPSKIDENPMVWMIGMVQLDPNWYLPSKIDENPMVWMIMVDGFILDARTMPREVQEIAYRKGLIPYIPKEKEG
ncbi:MAG: hypothetical protein JRI67_12570 [Deltaproteobacteria bacterium]|nr:hypothetical protein [Deltaproteobacteria bacterium]